jgi:hypothetical protein
MRFFYKVALIKRRIPVAELILAKQISKMSRITFVKKLMESQGSKNTTFALLMEEPFVFPFLLLEQYTTLEKRRRESYFIVWAKGKVLKKTIEVEPPNKEGYFYSENPYNRDSLEAKIRRILKEIS